MSEFLVRGWNVGIPEVDLGDDIFVVHQINGLLARVQVKSSIAIKRSTGFSARFVVSMRQLRDVFGDPRVHFVFVVRLENGWSRPLLFAQEVLLDYVQNFQMGSISNDRLSLYFSFSTDMKEAACSGTDISSHIGDYSYFPVVEL